MKTMDSILDQLPKKEQSLSSLFASHVIDTRNVRQQFTDEAVAIINKSREGTKWKPVTKRAVAIRINLVCPKEGGDAWVVDFRKACTSSKNYSKTFWGASRRCL